jgi:hypothetical protein
MNVGVEHVCIEAFYPALNDECTNVESLAILSKLNKEWNQVVATSMYRKRMNIIKAILGFVGNDGRCTLSNASFNISETKLDVDALCCLFKKLAVWQLKSRSQSFPDVYILFSDKIFLPKLLDDGETERVMNTMRLLIAGIRCEFFYEDPALKVCWMYLICNFIIYALNQDLYTEMFRTQTFSTAARRKVSTYREFLRINMGIPERLRCEMNSLLSNLDMAYKKRYMNV